MSRTIPKIIEHNRSSTRSQKNKVNVNLCHCVCCKQTLILGEKIVTKRTSGAKVRHYCLTCGKEKNII